MYYVYVLRSESHADQTYIGSAHDLRARLAQHNGGESIHTNKFKPWNLITYVALPDKLLAETFERCLKTGSGRAFAKRHLLSLSIRPRNRCAGSFEELSTPTIFGD